MKARHSGLPCPGTITVHMPQVSPFLHSDGGNVSAHWVAKNPRISSLWFCREGRAGLLAFLDLQPCSSGFPSRPVPLYSVSSVRLFTGCFKVHQGDPG